MAKASAKPAGLGAPKFTGELPEAPDAINLQELINRFNDLRDWAHGTTEFLDTLAARIADAEARFAALGALGAAQEQIAAQAEQLRGLEQRLALLAPLAGDAAQAAARIVTNGKPAGAVDMYLYHASKPAERARTRADYDRLIGEGFHESPQDAARQADGSVDEQLASQIYARGHKQEVIRPRLPSAAAGQSAAPAA